MNVFDGVGHKILELIENTQDDYINKFMAKYTDRCDILLYNKKLNINILGRQCSGKTALLNKILKKLNNPSIHIKHIKILDSYSEKDIFEELIIFNKMVINKNDRKLLLIDDYNNFSNLFKSKVRSLLKQSSIHISVIVGEIIPDNIYIYTDNVLAGLDTSSILNLIDAQFARETEILVFLLRNFKEFNNIKTLLNNINILRFMDFNFPTQLYYNNVIEQERVYNCLCKNTLNNAGLITILNEKYKNNENIKDVILLIEMCIFYIIQTDHKRLYSDLDSGLFNILDICSTIKNKILYLKHNKQHINDKLLFSYFILKIRCL